MTNSHKSQSEKLAAGGGRETAAKKPQTEGKKNQTARNHGREPPHMAPPSTPAYDPPPAETATACTTGAANATGERQIRLMTNSHKSQSEKLVAGGGRETAAKKPYNNEVPGPHH
jgi:Tfp pilus assembly major pilin PilA